MSHSNTALQPVLLRANRAIAANDLETAAAALNEARLFAPDHAGANRAYVQVHSNLSAQRLNLGDATGALRAALAALLLDPAHLDALMNAAAASAALADGTGPLPETMAHSTQALVLCERGLTRSPYHVEFKALRARARLRHSVLLAQNNALPAALEIASLDRGVAHALRQLALPQVYKNRAHLREARAGYILALEALKAAPPPLHLHDLLHSNALLAAQGENDRELQAQYGRWLCQQSRRFQPVRASTKPRTVALVSSFWRDCAIGNHFASWIEVIKNSGLDVALFQIGPECDEHTHALIARAGAGGLLSGSLSAIAETLAARGIDILIYPELGLDARTLVLASLQLARVQLCAWGQPSTSGLPSVDAFLSNSAEPGDAKTHYSERLMLLSGLGTQLPLPPAVVPQSPAQLGLPLGARVLVAQSSYQCVPDSDLRLVAVAQAAPAANFVLFEPAHAGPDSAIKTRLRATFRAHSLQPERLHWQPLPTRGRFLQIAAACDVALDTLGAGCFYSALDCLAVGTPVIAAAGEVMRARRCAQLLHALALPECVISGAQDTAMRTQFAEIAVTFLQHREARKSLAAKLAEPLREQLANTAFAPQLVEILQSYCAG